MRFHDKYMEELDGLNQEADKLLQKIKTYEILEGDYVTKDPYDLIDVADHLLRLQAENEK